MSEEEINYSKIIIIVSIVNIKYINNVCISSIAALSSLSIIAKKESPVSKNKITITTKIINNLNSNLNASISFF